MMKALTSRPAKLRLTDKSKIQAELSFIATIDLISQRGKLF